MSINNRTVTIGIGNTRVPCEGPKALAFLLDFTTLLSVPVDLSNTIERGKMSIIQGVYIDNRLNANVLLLTCSGSGQVILAAPYSQGYYQLLAPDPPVFVATNGATGIIIPIFFYNVAIEPVVTFDTTAVVPVLPAGIATAALQSNVQATIGATKANRGILTTNVGLMGGNPTYYATALGYTAYATPTDMFTINGSASKIIAVVGFAIAAQATAAILETFFMLKRSTANTGGTLTNPSAIAYDSADAAATAICSLYTAAPALGTLVGTIRSSVTNVTTTAQTPGQNNPASGVGNSFAISLVDSRKPIILRGTAESLCLNYNGAALPVGFTASFGIEFIEFLAP